MQRWWWRWYWSWFLMFGCFSNIGIDNSLIVIDNRRQSHTKTGRHIRATSFIKSVCILLGTALSLKWLFYYLRCVGLVKENKVKLVSSSQFSSYPYIVWGTWKIMDIGIKTCKSYNFFWRYPWNVENNVIYVLLCQILRNIPLSPNPCLHF